VTGVRGREQRKASASNPRAYHHRRHRPRCLQPSSRNSWKVRDPYSQQDRHLDLLQGAFRDAESIRAPPPAALRFPKRAVWYIPFAATWSVWESWPKRITFTRTARSRRHIPSRSRQQRLGYPHPARSPAFWSLPALSPAKSSSPLFSPWSLPLSSSRRRAVAFLDPVLLVGCVQCGCASASSPPTRWMKPLPRDYSRPLRRLRSGGVPRHQASAAGLRPLHTPSASATFVRAIRIGRAT